MTMSYQIENIKKRLKFKKNQMEIVKWKSIKMKNSLEGLKSIFELAEESVNLKLDH